jgi:streptomycin 6-kinase
MLAAAPKARGYPTAENWAAGFEWYFEHGMAEIPTELVRAAQETYIDLCRTQREVRLLHGDLQHHNVLFDEHRGWLAIDPKGVVAEIAFELGAPMRNPTGMPDLFHAPVIERRVSQFASGLGVDATRVIQWTFAQAVLSAIWTLEDGGSVHPDAPVLALASEAHALMA